jgi:hypothetical protein
VEPVVALRRLRGVSFPLRAVTRLTRVAVLLSALAIATVSVVGCGSSATNAIPAVGPLVSVEARGGLCATGPCGSTVYLERDGRAHSAAKPPNDLGVASAASMTTLTAAINTTDFAALKARRFTGQCPIVFDGQELVFEFAIPGGTQRIASCEVDIDWGSPLFVAVAAAIGQWVPLPLT